MVAKVLGLATGAVLASAGVWAFNEWRTVSDADRLEAAIVDHCLPYVTTGATPFSGLGRPVGVYDQATLRDTLTNGGSAILFDNRFVAQWGDDSDGRSDLRACMLDYSYVRADGIGFEVEIETLPDWINQIFAADAGIVAVQTNLDTLPSLLSWEEPNVAQFKGLRLYLAVQAGGVSSVLMVNSVER